MTIDLRSDTVTKPTPAMLQAMMSAEVGDDVYGEDPTVNKLEAKCAALLGMDAGIFCPSGTMTNQVGIKTLTQPWEEVICYEGSHIYRYEGGGLAGNSGLSVRLIDAPRGKLRVGDIEANVNPGDQHFPRTALVGLENTVNRAGGAVYRLSEIRPLSECARRSGLRLYLDGARLFNAIVATGDEAREYGQYFDVISICLSKGLGAPVGSVLVCKKEFEMTARRVRKVFGGAMRQAGYLAAAGVYALDHHITRLKEDHRRARVLGETLSGLPAVCRVMPVETNIVIFELEPAVTPAQLLEKLRASGIGAIQFGAREIRFVTHLDFTDDMLDQTVKALKALRF
jgi:threonine aldolase